MNCQKVIELYENLFSRIQRLKPNKEDSIFIKVKNCVIKILSVKNQLSIKIAKITDRGGEMMVIFSDFSALEYVLNAEDLLDYGNRLLYAVLDHKVLLDPGTVEKATQSGFFKLLSRSRFKKHIQIFELTIPVL